MNEGISNRFLKLARKTEENVHLHEIIKAREIMEEREKEDKYKI